jgi:hypothetical protein
MGDHAQGAGVTNNPYHQQTRRREDAVKACTMLTLLGVYWWRFATKQAFTGRWGVACIKPHHLKRPEPEPRQFVAIDYRTMKISPRFLEKLEAEREKGPPRDG